MFLIDMSQIFLRPNMMRYWRYQETDDNYESGSGCALIKYDENNGTMVVRLSPCLRILPGP